jgi:hypothetical protein
VKSFRLLGASLVLIGAASFSSVTTPVQAAMNPGPNAVSGTLLKLASNDGRFEAAGNSTWVVKTRDRVIPVDSEVEVQQSSGSLVSFSKKVGSEVTASSLSKAITVRRSVHSTAVVTNRTVTVVPLQWSGATWKSADRTVANGIATQLKTWWRSMSANQESLSVNFLSTVNVSSVNSAGQCNFYEMSDLALAYVEKQGLTESSDHVMMTFTGDNQDCNFGGLGEVEGKLTWTYTAPGYMGVWAHELGHNMGFPHANTCNAGVTLTYLKSCEEVEYGNLADTMGIAGASGYYAPTFLESVGWLPASNVAVWTGVAQTVTLNRPDRSDLGTTAVNILPTDVAAGDNEFWLQYNPNVITSISPAAAPVNGGVTITYEPSADFSTHRISLEGVVGAASSTSYLCDITPPTASLTSIDYANDPRLPALRSWTDPRNRFTVSVESTNGTSATVRIEPVMSFAVSDPATVTGTADQSGEATLNVAWGVAGSAYGEDEPSSWSVNLLEDATKACTAFVWESSCQILNVARETVVSPTVAGINGAVSSNRITSAATQLSNVAPIFRSSFTTTSDSVVATVHVENGGSEIQGTPTIEIAGREPCVLAVLGDTVCTFSDLPRKTAVQLIAKGTNATGSRETLFTTRTLAGLPEDPVLSAKFSGKNLLVTATAAELDQNNVNLLEVNCVVKGKQNSKYGFNQGATPASKEFSFTAVKGKDTYCYGRAMSTGNVKIYSSGYRLLHVLSSGKIIPGKIKLVPVVTSPKAGTVKIKWTVKDSLGVVSLVKVKISAGTCKSDSKTSCIAKNLVSGSTVNIAISVRGTSGSTIFRTSTVVK